MMMSHSRFSTLAVAALVSLAVIPREVRAAVFNVTVGGPGILKFNPDTVNAAVGDVVQFTFQQKNHTVTQSTFTAPCTPLEGGFDSGFVPVADDNLDGPFPTAQFTVDTTDPVWVFCRQANHCQQGMVFAINPTQNKSFDAFQAAAMSSGSSSSSTLSVSSSSVAAVSATGTPSAVTVTETVTASASGSVGTTFTTTYGSYPGSAAPTSAVSSDHLIVVGGPNKLFFNPANITAQPGDTITFQFQQKNHTVTQSSFNAPCQSLASTSTTGQGGFDSGFMPVADNQTNFPTFTVQINDTSPVWAYCRQATHCGQGMVFSVNAVESGPNNFEAFLAKAKAINGTGTSASASPSATKSGTMSTKDGVSGLGLLAFSAVVLGFVL